MQGDEVTGHDFDATVSHLNEATCTKQSGEQKGKQKNNENKPYLGDTDKMEKAHVLEPNRHGFESQFFHFLVQSTVNKLLTCIKCNILVYQKRGLILHINERFYEVHKHYRCSMNSSYLQNLLWCFFSY